MVCGPSGAGKSTLFGDLLHPAVACAIKHRRDRLTGREFARLTGFAADSAESMTFIPAGTARSISGRSKG